MLMNMHRLTLRLQQTRIIINGTRQVDGLARRCLSSTNTTTSLKDQERAGLTYASRPSNRTRIRDFASQYGSMVAAGERRSEIPPTVLTGRIVTPLRELSSNLMFFHIESEGARIQVLADRKHYGSADEFHSVHHKLRRGDIVSVEGFPGKTKKGELSIVSKATSLLAPCVKDLPMGRGDGKDAISDVGFLHKHREVGLLVGGSEARQVFQQRANVIRAIRSFLDTRSFLEVETPVLWPNSGGAFAKPFQTTTRNLTLRIAPELSLKRLVIGGYDKVYELGKVFRDEGTSPKHNPEFTSIELYEAYSNARDLEAFTRDMLRACFDAVHPNQTRRISPMFEIDFDAEYPRVSIADQLEALGGFRFDDASSVVPENILPLLNSKSRASLTPNDEKSIPRLLDKLVGQEVESKLDPKIPTFLVDHPVALSPLAKERPDRKGVVERFELFAGTFELCNAYSELNDPKIQRQRFADQLKYRLGGDEECQLPDESFCEALEYGLPPTAGWGMGVDRLVMVLLGKHSIKDVILFPHMSS